MRISQLVEGTVYRARAAITSHRLPAVPVAAEQWHRRTPYRHNTERPWELFLRNDQPSVGWSEPPTNARGIPMVVWTRAPFYGPFDDAALRALRRAASAVRLRFEMASRAVDQSQLRETIRMVVDGDIERFISVVVVAPQSIVEPFDLDDVAPAPEPEPVPESYPGAHILAVVTSGNRPAETVQDVQDAWVRIRPAAAPLSWGQVTLAGGGRTENDERVWAIRGLRPEYVISVRALAADGRFRIGAGWAEYEIAETADSAMYGWAGSEVAREARAVMPGG